MAKQRHNPPPPPPTVQLSPREMLKRRDTMVSAVLTGICSTPMVGEAITDILGMPKLADFAVQMADTVLARMSVPTPPPEENLDA